MAARILPAPPPGHGLRPVENIVAANGHEPDLKDHHDLLLANCLAQSETLMRGRTLDEARQMLAKGMEPRRGREDRAAPRLFRQPALVTILYRKLDPVTLAG